MINLVKDYYRALSDKKLELIENMLHKNMYGARLYNKSLLKTKTAFLDEISNLNINVINIEEVTTIGNNVHYRCFLRKGEVISGKMVIVDNKIYRIFETVNNGKSRIMLHLSYDGTNYEGYQKQPNKRTVQEEIEKALYRTFKTHINTYASGRTDKGVHALNQYVHFDVTTSIPHRKISDILNNYLPDDIYVYESKEIPITHHCRYDVKIKKYQYKLNIGPYDVTQRNYEWTVDNFDLDKAQKYASLFIGTHDFASFTVKTSKNTIRTIYDVKVNKEGNNVYIVFSGNGFLRYMVRYMVGAIIFSVNNKLSVSIEKMLSTPDNSLLSIIAPPNGLYLQDVVYE